MESLDPDDVAAIRSHLQQERALGSPRFKEMVEKTLNRSAEIRLPGRPVGTPVKNSNGNVL